MSETPDWPVRICHICHEPTASKGLSICSAAHGFPGPHVPDYVIRLDLVETPIALPIVKLDMRFSGLLKYRPASLSSSTTQPE